MQGLDAAHCEVHRWSSVSWQQAQHNPHQHGCPCPLPQVTEKEDLSRDVIKSDTAEVYIKELDLLTSTGSLGGLITTVEGLLTSVQVGAAASNQSEHVAVHDCIGVSAASARKASAVHGAEVRYTGFSFGLASSPSGRCHLWVAGA